MEPICFEIERLTLRSFRMDDTIPYFQLLAHPRVHCFVPDALDTPEQAADAVRTLMHTKDGSALSVCLKETGTWIGTVFGLWEGDTFSVCWNFLPEWGGKGYAYEAAFAYVDFLFRQKNARRIYAYVEDDNLPSQRLCRKLGMRQEGLFREFISFVNNPDGTPLYENTLQFALLKKEWRP